MPAASHPHPDINALYKRRRQAADASNTPGWKGIQGWAQLEDIEDRLRELDPDGDWQREGYSYPDGWQVQRPPAYDSANNCDRDDPRNGDGHDTSTWGDPELDRLWKDVCDSA